MTLDPVQLDSDIEAITAPASIAAAAAAWADAMENYAEDVVPALAPGVAASAASALEGSLASAFALTVAASTAAAMEAAFVTFGVAIAAGMAPAFTATPPPGPVGFSALLAGTQPSMAAAAAAWASAIDTWMKTGSATPSGGGAPVLWS